MYGEFLRHADNFVVPFLTNLFSRLYGASHFPLDWCKSVIIPLFKKKGDYKNSDNYRGILLLSAVSNVFTAILNKRLYTWAEHEQKISKEQAGFRKGYSTADHIFTLTSMITKKLNSKRGGKVYVVFVDYKKAFDSVNREALWDVLQKLQTSSKMIMILKAMYNSVRSCELCQVVCQVRCKPITLKEKKKKKKKRHLRSNHMFVSRLVPVSDQTVRLMHSAAHNNVSENFFRALFVLTAKSSNATCNFVLDSSDFFFFFFFFFFLYIHQIFRCSI